MSILRVTFVGLVVRRCCDADIFHVFTNLALYVLKLRPKIFEAQFITPDETRFAITNLVLYLYT